MTETQNDTCLHLGEVGKRGGGAWLLVTHDGAGVDISLTVKAPLGVACDTPGAAMSELAAELARIAAVMNAQGVSHDYTL